MATKETLSQIRSNLEDCVGQQVLLRTNKGKRNAKEKLAVVEAVYPSIFILSVNEGLDVQRRVSFSYSDVLTETVEITICETEERIQAS